MLGATTANLTSFGSRKSEFHILSPRPRFQVDTIRFRGRVWSQYRYSTRVTPEYPTEGLIGRHGARAPANKFG